MERIKAFVLARDHFFILTHVRPDGDALGSAAALCYGLRALGKTAYVAPNSGITGRFLPYVEGVLPPLGLLPQTVVSVDCSTRARLPVEQSAFAVDVILDHHTTREPYAPLAYIDPTAAATGEIIFDLLMLLEVPLTQEIALPLYLALATDTGCFRFSNTTAKTHAIAARLMETGIDVTKTNEVMFETKSQARLKLETHLYQTMVFHHEGRVAFSVLDTLTMTRTGATEDDIGALSSLGRHVEGVGIAAMLRQEPEGFKLSIRSLAPYRADRICAQMGGGGHIRAAGATIEGTLEQATAAVMSAIAEELRA